LNQESLFKYIKLLREKYYKEPGFNLFTTLRSSSDEVRLHSRFLAALLDSRSWHTGKGAFLKLFTQGLDIRRFDTDSACRVCIEYKNIDILITNQKRQAIVIENKIYADDQDEQLSRYYETMLTEGYTDITLIYLTLDGSEPDDQSIAGIPSKFLESDHYQCVSYVNLKNSWLEDCLCLSARNPALRESIVQYIELIGQLTGTEQSDDYMNDLVELLNKDNNILAIHDIQEAYTRSLIDLQLDLWAKIDEAIKHKLPDISGPDSDSLDLSDRDNAVDDFYRKQRNNKYYGLYYPLKNCYPDAFLAVEIDWGIYIGIHCSKDDTPDTYNKLEEKLRHIGRSTTAWPSVQHIDKTIQLKVPSPDELKLFISEEYRKQYANDCADELYRIWHIVHD